MPACRIRRIQKTCAMLYPRWGYLRFPPKSTRPCATSAWDIFVMMPLDGYMQMCESILDTGWRHGKCIWAVEWLQGHIWKVQDKAIIVRGVRDSPASCVIASDHLAKEVNLKCFLYFPPTGNGHFHVYFGVCVYVSKETETSRRYTRFS